MQQFDLPDYMIPICPIPLFILKFILFCLGRNNINPRCNYSQDKLVNSGFKKTIDLDTGLLEFACWYRTNLKT